MKKLLLGFLTGISSMAVMIAAPLAAKAASQIIVTPSQTQGWSTADTRPGGAVNYIVDPTAPGSPKVGALQLTTDLTTTSKAQYLHNTNTPLSTVNDLSYYTKQNSPPGIVADPSYQLVMCLTGVNATGCNANLSPPASSFTTLVYEPYQGGGGAIIPGAWQQWDVDQGLFWSTKTVTCSGGTVVGTPGGPATYTLAQIKTICPSAVVVQFGVNIGSNNPGYNVETDLFNFNGTVYNFEPYQVATDKDQCKKGGFANFTDSNGNPFKNQGQCEKFVKDHSDKDKHDNKDEQDNHQDGENSGN